MYALGNLGKDFSQKPFEIDWPVFRGFKETGKYFASSPPDITTDARKLNPLWQKSNTII